MQLMVDEFYIGMGINGSKSFSTNTNMNMNAYEHQNLLADSSMMASWSSTLEQRDDVVELYCGEIDSTSLYFIYLLHLHLRLLYFTRV